MKCDFSRVSRKGTPLAIFVSQMITRGLGSVNARAASNALVRVQQIADALAEEITAPRGEKNARAGHNRVPRIDQPVRKPGEVEGGPPPRLATVVRKGVSKPKRRDRR